MVFVRPYFGRAVALMTIEKNPLYSPITYVLIGGLISSTLLSRIVTPVLYKLLAPRVG